MADGHLIEIIAAGACEGDMAEKFSGLSDGDKTHYRWIASSVVGALTDAGYAVVALPEPDDGLDWLVDLTGIGGAIHVRIDPFGAIDCPVSARFVKTPDEARALAAALLAAAAQAEADRG